MHFYAGAKMMAEATPGGTSDTIVEDAVEAMSDLLSLETYGPGYTPPAQIYEIQVEGSSASGQQVSGTITLNVENAGGGGPSSIKRVKFFDWGEINGGTGTSVTSAPWELTYDTLLVPNKVQTIYVTAVRQDDSEQPMSITVEVSNLQGSPQTQILFDDFSGVGDGTELGGRKQPTAPNTVVHWIAPAGVQVHDTAIKLDAEDEGASFWLPAQSGTILERELILIYSFNSADNRLGFSFGAARNVYDGEANCFEFQFGADEFRSVKRVQAEDSYNYVEQTLHEASYAIDETRRYKLHLTLHTNLTSATVVVDELDGGSAGIYSQTFSDLEFPGDMVVLRAMTTTTYSEVQSMEILEQN